MYISLQSTFVNRVKTTDCQAELRRLLATGPPIYISDKHAMPLPEHTGDTHVCKLWYASDNLERSAKLSNAVEGAERDALWEELKQFIIVEGKEPGDDDDDNGGDGDGEGEEGRQTNDGEAAASGEGSGESTAGEDSGEK